MFSGGPGPEFVGHRAGGQMPFRCAHCGYSTFYKESLTAHFREQHPEEMKMDVPAESNTYVIKVTAQKLENISIDVNPENSDD